MPKSTKALPSQEELLRILSYDPLTGYLRWRMPRQGRIIGGIIGAGRKPGKGYTVKYNQIVYKAARIIFKMLYNEEPPEVDHKDLDPSNNRKENLRAATSIQNMWNKGKNSTNTSGVKGVFKTKGGKFSAQIKTKGKRTYLGCFFTIEEAKTAYENACIEQHGAFGRVE